MIVIFEGLVMCFLLLLTCVIGIANGPVGLAILYEEDVQKRVVELGLTTEKQLKRNFALTAIALFVPIFVLVPIMVYCVNGADGFWDGFTQMTAIVLIQGIFDRIFIDRYWVGHTKAWEIPGTEDLKPYIPRRMLLVKWLGTLVIFPALMAGIAALMEAIR